MFTWVSQNKVFLETSQWVSQAEHQLQVNIKAANNKRNVTQSLCGAKFYLKKKYRISAVNQHIISQGFCENELLQYISVAVLCVWMLQSDEYWTAVFC